MLQDLLHLGLVFREDREELDRDDPDTEQLHGEDTVDALPVEEELDVSASRRQDAGHVSRVHCDRHGRENESGENKKMRRPRERAGTVAERLRAPTTTTLMYKVSQNLFLKAPVRTITWGLPEPSRLWCNSQVMLTRYGDCPSFPRSGAICICKSVSRPVV